MSEPELYYNLSSKSPTHYLLVYGNCCLDQAKRVGKHCPNMFAVGSNGLAYVALKEICTESACQPKITENSDFFQMYCIILDFMHICIAKNSTILFIYLSVHLETGLITEDHSQPPHTPYREHNLMSMIVLEQLQQPGSYQLSKFRSSCWKDQFYSLLNFHITLCMYVYTSILLLFSTNSKIRNERK